MFMCLKVLIDRVLFRYSMILLEKYVVLDFNIVSDSYAVAAN